MRNTLWLGLLLPVALLTGGFAIRDLSEVGVSISGVAGVTMALAAVSARFWVRRPRRRHAFI